MSQFDYINKHYGLNIRKGTRLEYTGDPRNPSRLGTVASAAGAHINVKFDDDPSKVVGPFHPTWEMRYFNEVSP